MKYNDFTIIFSKKPINEINDSFQIRSIENGDTLITVYSNQIDSFEVANYSIYINGNILIRDEVTYDRSTDIRNCLISLYISYGDAFINFIEGTFIVIVFCNKTKSVRVFRDKLGGESAYYYTDPDQTIISSRLNLLAKSLNKKIDINKKIIPSFLYHHYIISPYTIYENIFKAKPGEMIMLNVGEVKKSIVASLVSDYFTTSRKTKITSLEAQNRVENFLQLEINSLVKGKKIGTFLSGGIDSSLVTAIAQKCSDSKVKSYTIGFMEDKYDEAIYAADIAKIIGVDHKICYMDENLILEYINKITEIYDEPFADSSQIATMYAYDMAAKDVDIVLGGDGGDEFFYGYEMFESARKMQKLGWLIYPMANLIQFFRIDRKIILPPKIRIVLDLDKGKSSKSQFYSIRKLDSIRRMVNTKNIIDPRFLLEKEYKTAKWDEKLMMVHFETSLPDDMMIKVDRPAKYNGFYPISPLLAEPIIRFTHRIPLKKKYSRSVGKKAILKNILFKYVPKDLFDRPKKGFSVPLNNILRNRLWDSILELCDKTKIEKQDIFNFDNLLNELTSYKMGTGSTLQDRDVFAYYIFQKWYQKNVSDE